MAHISDLRASIYSYLDIHSVLPLKETVLSEEFAALFVGDASAEGDTTGVTALYRVPSVREFPAIGTPANVVNVPVYGQPISSQVQGQADAPSMEITINFNAEDAQEIYLLEGKQVTFRFMMTAGPITELDSFKATIEQPNTEFYFVGRIEAILVNPSLTDATTATVTISIQSDFVGPATIASA
jgi:hypothetical protein